MKALLMKPRTKRLLVGLCGACAKRVSFFRTIEVIGSGFLLLALFLPSFYKIGTTPQIYGTAVSLWIGLFMMAAGDMTAKKAVGTGCTLLSDGRWQLWFTNGTFRREFVDLNMRFVEKG
jgi:hypothetical protein